MWTKLLFFSQASIFFISKMEIKILTTLLFWRLMCVECLGTLYNFWFILTVQWLTSFIISKNVFMARRFLLGMHRGWNSKKWQLFVETPLESVWRLSTEYVNHATDGTTEECSSHTYSAGGFVMCGCQKRKSASLQLCPWVCTGLFWLVLVSSLRFAYYILLFSFFLVLVVWISSWVLWLRFLLNAELLPSHSPCFA